METKVYSINGKEKGTIKLDDSVFNRDVSEGSIYYAIRNELANKRVGTASSKSRGEIKGSTRKPWAQKGTGHARAGDRKSGVMVGGGVIFGPKPRDYSYTMPRKMKRTAFKSILSMKNKDGNLKVVENFTVESGKTKDIAVIMKNLVAGEKTVLILSEEDQNLKRAAKNIPWLRYLTYDKLNAHVLFYGKKILVQEGAVEKLNQFFTNKKEVEA
jgi:large subunit ribosomal protein L4